MAQRLAAAAGLPGGAAGPLGHLARSTGACFFFQSFGGPGFFGIGGADGFEPATFSLITKALFSYDEATPRDFHAC